MQSNDPVKKFLNEEQDPEVVERVHSKMSEILTSNEEVQYIAVQKKPVVNVSPDSVLLTTKRLIVFRPRILGGLDFEDHVWRDIANVHLKEGVFTAMVSIETVAGAQITIDYLPKTQARRLYSIAQEMEEKVREERRERELEDKRAAAGGVVVQNATPDGRSAAAKEDPMQILTKLKGMLDAGLITQNEYDAKKSDILSRM